MFRARRMLAVTTATLLVAGLAACASDDNAGEGGNNTGTGDFAPVTIQHAFGSTEITQKPERVATVSWANQEVPLALGVVPVGMQAATFGDDDDNGMLPWVEDRLEELDAEAPVLFDETDGIDFEAVADTVPDVILAAYSGLTQEDYDTLSEIAPVVAYPETAWGTSWRDMILLNSEAMGMQTEGEQLVADLEDEIATTVSEHPALDGTSAMFLTHVDTTDLSEVSFYTTHDTRTAFFEDLGLSFPQSLIEASDATEAFSSSISSEQVDTFSDVDVIVTYGGEELVAALEGDPILSQMPAVQNDAIVPLPSDGPLGTAANPTPLSISYILDEYVTLLAEAAAKSE